MLASANELVCRSIAYKVNYLGFARTSTYLSHGFLPS